MPIPNSPVLVLLLCFPWGTKSTVPSVLLGKRDDENQAAHKTVQRLLKFRPVGERAWDRMRLKTFESFNIPENILEQSEQDLKGNDKEHTDVNSASVTAWEAVISELEKLQLNKLFPFSLSEVLALDRQRIEWSRHLNDDPSVLCRLSNNLPFSDVYNRLKNREHWNSDESPSSDRAFKVARVRLWSIAYILACFDAEHSAHFPSNRIFLTDLFVATQNEHSTANANKVWLSTFPMSLPVDGFDWLKGELSEDPDSDRQQRWRLSRGKKIGVIKARTIIQEGCSQDSEREVAWIRYLLMNLVLNLTEGEKRLFNPDATDETPAAIDLVESNGETDPHPTLSNIYPPLVEIAKNKLRKIHEATGIDNPT